MNFEDYFYKLNLEFESLKSDSEKNKFYDKHYSKIEYKINECNIDKFGIRKTICKNGDSAWQGWIAPKSGEIWFSKNGYKSKGTALMNILYGIHIGKFK